MTEKTPNSPTNLLPNDHVGVSSLCAPTAEVCEMLAQLRKLTANKIAEELCAVQPMDGVTYESLKSAMDWLTKSRLSRGVHPITEEPLDGGNQQE